MNSYMVHLKINKLIVFVQVPLFFPLLYFSAEYSKHIFLENTKLYMSIYFLYDTDTIFYYKYGMYYG